MNIDPYYIIIFNIHNYYDMDILSIGLIGEGIQASPLGHTVDKRARDGGREAGNRTEGGDPGGGSHVRPRRLSRRSPRF